MLFTMDDRAGAVFDEPARKYRYRLWRRWGEEPSVCFLMLNPSTADEYELDPTLRRCAGFAKRWGAGGIEILNLFALRSTDPDGIYTMDDPVGPDNDRTIRALASVTPEIVVAWGVHGSWMNRAEAVLEILRQTECVPLCLGVTKDGHPRHPLYLRGTTERRLLSEALEGRAA